MKKLSAILVAAVLVIATLAGCGAPSAPAATTAPPAETTPDATGSASPKLQKIVVGASPTPHAQILAIVEELMLHEGYELIIEEFTDYVQPNMALEQGELDANYFQHQPYLDDFNAEKGTDLVSLAAIHYEPLGLYPGKTASLEDLKDGAQIAVPSDTTNEARALLLLESLGLIKLKEGADLKVTAIDIVENPKNLKIVEIEAAQLPRVLPDVDMAVINGNYAIEAGLNAATDALAKEEKDSLAATTFANILVVRKGDESREDLQALVKAMQSEEVRKYIEDTYQGGVVPTF